jgi:hypothetical protein|tara:strand:+ start:141 stop:260 length:120 start_codon:yes stop_codon:yes gene_type:complete
MVVKQVIASHRLPIANDFVGQAMGFGALPNPFWFGFWTA